MPLLHGKQVANSSIGRAALSTPVVNQILSVVNTGGAFTTSDTAWTTMSNLTTTFTPRAGEIVIAILSVVATHTTGIAANAMGCFDIEHNNSGSFVREFGGNSGLFIEPTAANLEYPVLLFRPISLPVATSTTIRAVWRTSLGTLRCCAATTGTEGASARFSVVRY